MDASERQQKLSEQADQFVRDAESPDAHNFDALDPELRDHVRVGASGLVMVHHPMVVDLFPIVPSVNRRYEQKKEMFAKALARHDLTSMIGIVERPYRLDKLFEWQLDGIVTTDEVLDELPFVWSDAEPDDTQPAYRQMWINARATARRRERALGDELPDVGDPLVVYRGQHSATERRGIAWSLNPNIAKGFARRFNTGEFGIVLRGRVMRRQVLAYINAAGRGEEEVVAPPRYVRITGWTLVPNIGDVDLADPETGWASWPPR